MKKREKVREEGGRVKEHTLIPKNDENHGLYTIQKAFE